MSRMIRALLSLLVAALLPALSPIAAFADNTASNPAATVVAPTGDLAAAKPVTNDRKRGIRQHFWAQDGTHLL
jgi:hypothetical protein